MPGGERAVATSGASFRPATLLVLAAGASTRLGGRPKATVDVGGRPAVRRILEVARLAGVATAVVVVGRHAAEIEASLIGESVTLVRNEAWAAGRTGSLQLGLALIPVDSDVVLWPVDHPFVEAITVRALADTASADPLATWVIPTYEGRGGHPVWLKPAVRSSIAALASDAPLRGLLPRLGPQVLRVAVRDPGVVASTDTAEEYSAAVRRFERRG